MDAKQSVREHFGSAAERYAASWPHRGGPDLEAMLAGAGPEPGDRVLDVGCGAGHTAFAFATRAREVVALDLTEAMLAQTRAGAAERDLGNLEARLGDAEALPFDDGSFDVVTSRLAAHHFPHAERFVGEAFRVLAPGGRLLLSDSISPEDDAQDTYGNAIEVLRDPSHVRNHRVTQWRSMFEQAGFATAEQLGCFPCPLDFDVWTQRMSTPEQAREGLRALFAAAPSEVRAAYRLDPAGGSWQLDIAVLRARK
jgi:SAM-dependent methyltransferase